ncbi:eukaryotic translation initiation factor 4E transporter [Nematostella vectensis]|uniref:eukaryotic translation initiation factor 4E transporter n=1 Tax=Nematostella vectensis TaxID=45351 RepID=UPI002076EB88|nr:eukaryotic translation initiation factor 4E transporter [Nematostella vectensis]
MEVEEPSKNVGSVHARGKSEKKDSNGGEKPFSKENEEVPSAIGTEEKTAKDSLGDGESEPEATRVMYSKDELVALKESPSCRAWPSILSEEFVRNGIWDPEIWHQSSLSEKRCASPVDDIRRQMLEDGIVLSPQRQSFGQGCHVPQSAPDRAALTERPKSMLTRTLDREPRDGRSRLTGRVGRGGRTTEYRERERPPLRERNRSSDVRQSSPWERGLGERKTGREDNRKDRRRDVEEEPEWLNYEPDSSEIVELKGFDDDMFPERQRKGKRKTILDELVTAGNDLKSFSGVSKQTPEPVGDKTKDDKGFDLDQFFMTDTVVQFSGMADQQNASRFSQFFGVHGSGSHNGSRRSSTAEELMEYSGLSIGSPVTSHTASPTQPFVFVPIKPVDASTDPVSLEEMLEKTRIDVKPLLENVLSSEKDDNARVKGPCRLEDLEQQVLSKKEKQLKKEPADTVEDKPPSSQESTGQDMAAFFKLVETMKSSGHLPEKPQPVIPGLPSKYLPRPPSPKLSKSPSPLQKLRRSPSPAEMVQQLMMQTQMQPRRPPSPAQVVPQLDGSQSPFEILHKSIVMSPHDLLPVSMHRQTPSPVNYMHADKGLKPLLGPEAFTSPVPSQSFMSPRPPMGRLPPFDLAMNSPQSHQTPSKMHMGKPLDMTKTKSIGKEVPSSLRDLGFMPTSVLMHMKKDQMTPKGKDEAKSVDHVNEEEGKFINGNETRERNEGVKPAERPLSPKSQLLREIAASGPISRAPANGPVSPQQTRNIPHNDGSPLLKPTAFRPYPGSSYSPEKSGSHSEPQSPGRGHQSGSPNRRQLPHSAPVTPQRHPHGENMIHRSPLVGKSSTEEVRGDVMEREMMIRAKADEQIRSEMKARSAAFSNGPLQGKGAYEHERLVQQQLLQHRMGNRQNERSSPQRHEEGQQQLQGGNHSPGQHHMQQRREALPEQHRQGRPIPVMRQHPRQDYSPMLQAMPDMRPMHSPDLYRHRAMPPTHMAGGRMSPQSLLGTPRMPPTHTPFNSPMVGIPVHHKQGTPPGMMRPTIHPAQYLRMMQHAGRVPPNVPMQPPMFPGQSPLMYGPGMGGYGGVNPALLGQTSNFPGGPRPANMRGPPQVSSPQPHYGETNNASNDNILSKWFGEDVLRVNPVAKAQKPPDFSKKVLSLEEVERQHAMVNT